LKQKVYLIGNSIYCDTLEKEIRPYIPGSLRRQIFDMVHQMSHSNGRATHRQIAQKFVWPSMAKEWGRTCLASNLKFIGLTIPRLSKKLYSFH